MKPPLFWCYFCLYVAIVLDMILNYLQKCAWISKWAMFSNAQHPRDEQVRLSDSKVLVFSKLGKIHARLQAYFVHFVSISIQFCIIPVKNCRKLWKTIENAINYLIEFNCRPLHSRVLFLLTMNLHCNEYFFSDYLKWWNIFISLTQVSYWKTCIFNPRHKHLSYWKSDEFHRSLEWLFFSSAFHNNGASIILLFHRHPSIAFNAFR